MFPFLKIHNDFQLNLLLEGLLKICHVNLIFRLYLLNTYSTRESNEISFQFLKKKKNFSSKDVNTGSKTLRSKK